MKIEHSPRLPVVSRNMMKSFWKWVSIIAAVGAATSVARAAATSAPPADIRHDATVEAVQRALPAVVNIRTETIVERHDPFEELFQSFWGPRNRRPQTETTYSLGSGVIIDEDGWVMTNFHVVSRATKVFVRLADG